MPRRGARSVAGGLEEHDNGVSNMSNEQKEMALSNKSEALCVLAASKGLEPHEGAYHVEKEPSKNWLSSY
jgi:hypothetical protein